MIATKLYHPFDTLPRHASSLADPAALTIDWPTWVDAHKAHDASNTSDDHIPRGSEINITEADVMKMTGEQLDEYMDYYERTFIDAERIEQKEQALPKELLDMFPIGRPENSSPLPYSYERQVQKEQQASEQILKTMVSSMKLRPVVAEDSEEPVRPIGSFYKRYRKVEDLQGPAKVFHEKVAKLVGVKLETVVLAVGQVERRLIKWREGKVKEGLEEDDENIGEAFEEIGVEAQGEDVEMEDEKDGDDYSTDGG